MPSICTNVLLAKVSETDLLVKCAASSCTNVNG